MQKLPRQKLQMNSSLVWSQSLYQSWPPGWTRDHLPLPKTNPWRIILSLKQGKLSTVKSTPMETDTRETDTRETDMRMTDTRVMDRLLSLRQDYTKTSVALVKADAHLNFVSTCQTNKKTPKGLRVGVQCPAFPRPISSTSSLKPPMKQNVVT